MPSTGALKAVASVATATTDGAVASAVAGKKIRVLALAYVGGTTVGAVTFNTKPAGAGTAIGPAFVAAASTPVVLPYNPKGWFETNLGEGLTATTGATTSAVTILVTYELTS